MTKYWFELRTGRQLLSMRDGDYPDLAAARCEAIVEARNLVAEGASDGVIEIRDARRCLVSQIMLRDVKLQRRPFAPAARRAGSG